MNSKTASMPKEKNSLKALSRLYDGVDIGESGSPKVINSFYDAPLKMRAARLLNLIKNIFN